MDQLAGCCLLTAAGCGEGSQGSEAEGWVLLPPDCWTMGQLLHQSRPQFPHLRHGHMALHLTTLLQKFK